MAVECSEENSDFEWTPYFEVHLIHSMGGLKLLGINQHFLTAIVVERFYSAVDMQVPIETVLKKLRSYYDLDEGRDMFRYVRDMYTELPFLNEPIEFSLPPEDFPNLGKRELDDRFSTDENSLGSKSESSSSVSSDVSLKKELKSLSVSSKFAKKDGKKSIAIVTPFERKSGGTPPQGDRKRSSATHDSPSKVKEDLKKQGKKRPGGGERKSDQAPPVKRARHSTNV